MIGLTFNNLTPDKNHDKSFFEKILTLALSEMDYDVSSVGLSVNLVDPSRIRKLNHRYRQQDKVTDVLSFDLGKKEIGGIIELGDIFICPTQAKDDNQLALLTIHGLLHLLGYDHEKSEVGKRRMFALQNKILKKCVNQ